MTDTSPAQIVHALTYTVESTNTGTFFHFLDTERETVYTANAAFIRYVRRTEGHAEITRADLDTVLAGLDDLEEIATTEQQGRSIRALGAALRRLQPKEPGTVV